MGKYPEIEEKMEKRINGYAGELKTIRAGRANASVLDKVAIDYYGTMTPVQQVGSISHLNRDYLLFNLGTQAF